jgi:hypothetical protein
MNITLIFFDDTALRIFEYEISNIFEPYSVEVEVILLICGKHLPDRIIERRRED